MTAPSADEAPRGEARPTCSTCPFWKHGFRSVTSPFDWMVEHVVKYAGGALPDVVMPIYFGDCRFHAARPIAVPDGEVFGRTHEDDWCGDHPDFPSFLASRRSHPHA